MKINWNLFFIGFIVWVTVGWMVFNNIVGITIFIILGGTSSMLLATKKQKQCN